MPDFGENSGTYGNIAKYVNLLILQRWGSFFRAGGDQVFTAVVVGGVLVYVGLQFVFGGGAKGPAISIDEASSEDNPVVAGPGDTVVGAGGLALAFVFGDFFLA